MGLPADTSPLQAIVEKVSSAAQALQARADSVPALERRVAQLEGAAVAADEQLAGAQAETAAALQRAEKAEAAVPPEGSGKDDAAPEADQQQVHDCRAAVRCRPCLLRPLLPCIQPLFRSSLNLVHNENARMIFEHQDTECDTHLLKCLRWRSCSPSWLRRRRRLPRLGSGSASLTLRQAEPSNPMTPSKDHIACRRRCACDLTDLMWCTCPCVHVLLCSCQPPGRQQRQAHVPRLWLQSWRIGRRRRWH